MKSLKISRFLGGVKSGLGVTIGYLPIGMTYGFLARTGGLTFLETELMSLLVYAGASQFIALNLIALGASSVQIVFTVFLVNIRHFLMSTSLSEKIESSSVLSECLFSFGITDETFAVSSIREGDLYPSFMFGLNLTAYIGWVGGSGVGYLLGKSLPLVLKEGMSIALYALFIGLLVPSIRKNFQVLILAGLAGAISSGLRPLLSSGWSIVLASSISAVVVTLFHEGGWSLDLEESGADGE